MSEIPQSAAVCVIKRQIVLITNKAGTRWVLPKGHLEPTDPTYGFRAEREAWEEAGVKGELVPQAIGSYPYQKQGRDYRVRVFLLNDCRLAEQWPEKEKRKRLLVTPSEAANLVREPELQVLLREFSLSLPPAPNSEGL